MYIQVGGLEFLEFDGTILYKIEGSGDRQEERRYFAPI